MFFFNLQQDRIYLVDFPPCFTRETMFYRLTVCFPLLKTPSEKGVFTKDNTTRKNLGSKFFVFIVDRFQEVAKTI